MEVPSDNPAVTDLEAHAASAWEFFRSIGSPKFHVAPMVDQSELAFRQLCRAHGATAAYTPMLHSRLFLENPKYRAEHFTTCPEDRPLFVQFCANDPKTALAAAKLVEDECDAIDLNLGCPQRIAKKGNYGAFLMDDLPKVKAVVEELYRGLKIPVTCKIRRFPEVEKTIAYARMLESAGCKLLCIHGRLREQKDASKVLADWNYIRAVKAALKIPVLGNGNVQCLQDAQALMHETGVDGVMSADPLLCNPALFSGRHLSGDANCKVLLEYLDYCAKYPTPMRMVKGHVHRMLRGWFQEHHDLRDQFNKESHTLAQVRQVAAELSERIAASGRDEPIPKITERAQARKEAEEARQLAIAAAIAEQKREDDAIQEQLLPEILEEQ
ncbi:hypothetical protein CYMTET_53364 [Cymbomonas tetramitiformis]|uniref:tRNA-dihydrouridine(16/17) synthase [NAD(P)(+)] n=1 Tax=Cymbomonas tetramitiformis TaxID=36881 RepID=A0AAE0ERT6_9CHLO|nr:hypothetical protein CYMTET_53364 [Cymbomonas tetramitiformis]